MKKQQTTRGLHAGEPSHEGDASSMRLSGGIIRISIYFHVRMFRIRASHKNVSYTLLMLMQMWVVDYQRGLHKWFIHYQRGSDNSVSQDTRLDMRYVKCLDMRCLPNRNNFRRVSPRIGE